MKELSTTTNPFLKTEAKLDYNQSTLLGLTGYIHLTEQ